MKNLLIISLHADPYMAPGVGEWGGTHKYCKEILLMLSKTDINVVLITRKSYPYLPEYEIVFPNCKIVRIEVGHYDSFSKKELYELRDVSYSQTKKELSNIGFRPDMIHSVYWNSGQLAARLSSEWSIPFVHSIISNGKERLRKGMDEENEKRIDVESEVFSAAANIICITDKEKEDIATLYNIELQKIIVVGRYIHPVFIYPAHDRNGFPRSTTIRGDISNKYIYQPFRGSLQSGEWWNGKAFVYTGRLAANKGLSVIFKAWYILYDKYSAVCPPLWIVGGSASDIENVRKLIKKGVDNIEKPEQEGKILWWGYLDEAGLSAVYTRGLALIAHSIYEPGGRVIVEAMSSGLPVIATRVGFAADIIEPWINGLFVEYGDYSSLALCMDFFVKQPFLTPALGANARKTALTAIRKWSFEEKHLSLYSGRSDQKSLSTYLPLQEKDFSDLRAIRQYPYNQLFIAKKDIAETLEKNNIYDISDIEEINNGNGSSYLWYVECKNQEYMIKIPCDRINIYSIVDCCQNQDVILLGRKRYQAEIWAASFKDISPILGKDDAGHAIIRKYYRPSKTPSPDSFPKVFQKIIDFYKDNSGVVPKNAMSGVDRVLINERDISKADSEYHILCSVFPHQICFINYSLRAEILRWKQVLKNCPPSIYDDILLKMPISLSKLYEIAESERHYSPVMLHGGVNSKNIIITDNDDIPLLDNENLHIGWPGYDIADYLSSYAASSLELPDERSFWLSVCELIPKDMIPQRHVFAWLLFIEYSDMIFSKVRLLPFPQSRYERIDILAEIIQQSI